MFEESSIDQLILDLKSGKMIILLDDKHRENEADLICAAEFITTHKINFFINKAKGLLCLALSSEKADQLGLPLISDLLNKKNISETNFTISIDAAKNISSGISAFDRTQTIQQAVNDFASREDFVSPGHVFPLRAVSGGVRERAGHTEASIELMKLANLKPCAILSEILDEDGNTLKSHNIAEFANENNIKIGTIKSLITLLQG